MLRVLERSWQKAGDGKQVRGVWNGCGKTWPPTVLISPEPRQRAPTAAPDARALLP